MTWNWKTALLWQRLLVAVLIVGAASAFRTVFFGALGRGIPYLVFYPAVMLAALYGGLAGGFLATALSVPLSFFWVQRGYLSPPEWLGMMVFVLSCLMVSAIGEAMCRAQKKADAANQELQREGVEHKRAAGALQKSEERFRTLFEQATESQHIAHVGSWSWNLTGPIHWTDETYRIFGVSPETFTPTPESLINLIHPEDRSLLQRWMAACAAGRIPGDLEFRSIWPDGTVRFINGRGELSCDAAGKPFKLVGTAQDITERRQVEERLRETNEYLSKLFDYANAPIIVWDPQFRITRFNHAFEAVTGRSSDEVVGQSLELLFPPALVENSMTLIRKTLTGERWETVEIPIQHHDGSVRTLLWNTATIFTSDDKYPVATIAQGHDITERKQAERALETSEKRFRDIASHAGEWIWEVDAEGKYTYASQAVEKILGYTPEEILQKHFYDLFDPEDGEAMKAQAVAAFVVKQPFWEHINRNVHKNGQIIWLSTSGLPLLDEKGNLQGYRGTDSDITARKRAEEALRKSEISLSLALQMAHAGYWEYDVSRDLFTFNDSFYRIFRVTADDMGGYQMSSADYARRFCHPDDTILVGKETQAAIESTDPDYSRRVEHRFLYPNGEVGYLAVRCSIVKDASGRTIKTYGVNQDITESRQAENELRQSRDLLSSLARLVPGVVYQYRLYPDGRSAFPFSSPGMNDIYEVTPEQVREDATLIFGRLHPEDAARVSADIYESARTLRTFYCEFRVILPRQGLRWRWSQAHPERMADGGTLWHGIISDITERKLAEEEHAKLQTQLVQAQKMESVGRLAGGIAHDFNNLLMGVIGYAELSRELVGPSHPVYGYLNAITTAAERSANLTRQLLAFARKQTIAPKVLDINNAVSTMLKLLQRLIGEDIAINWRPGVNLWTVKMDPSQIDQILANLAVNARDAIKGVGSISIETGNVDIDQSFCSDHPGFRPGSYVLLMVSDTGCGMDRETVEHIFEPFFTTKAVGDGTGLGLATVYGIVKQNEGCIDVDSEPGKGTTFKIRLPRFVTIGPAEAVAVSPAERPRGSETILLVEDDKSVRTITHMFLKSLGYNLLVAEVPKAALRLVSEHPGEIHLLITDVVMPGMSGRDLAQRLSELHPTIKKLFISGFTADVIAQRGILEDDINFLSKPFGRDQLARKVREVLGSGCRTGL